MKLLNAILLTAISLMIVGSFVSCSAVDVKVDRSKLKVATDTHDIYPSSAVTPIVNPEKVNELIRQGVDKVSDYSAKGGLE